MTPVVGFLGDLTADQLRPNPDEVAECFTIPIYQTLEEDKWVYDEKNQVSPASPEVIRLVCE